MSLLHQMLRELSPVQLRSSDGRFLRKARRTQAILDPLLSLQYQRMRRSWRALATRLLLPASCLLLLAGAIEPCSAVELKVSRDAIERTLKQKLFDGPNGRYYLKGSATSACSVYAEDPKLSFVQNRIVVEVKTHARLGKSVAGTCLGISLTLPAEVSLAPVGEGESIGFRDARLDRVSDQKQLNFLLTPFLSHQIPSLMKVNAADLLRSALQGSTASSGYKVTLERLKIHSVEIQGDSLIVDADGDLSVQ